MRVGLDIGATKILGAVVAADGAVLAQFREPTVPGADGVLATATRVLDRLAAEFDGVLPSHVGIGFPGLVDRDRGAVSHAVNLGLGDDWLPLAERLAERTGAAVMVENDVRAATWGAHILSGADDLGYLSIGTGLAAGFVLGGVLRRGAAGASGEIGHVPVDPDGALCSCGQRGCLELTAAASALTAAWPTDGAMSPAAAVFAAAVGRGSSGGRGPRPFRVPGGRRDQDARPLGRPGRDRPRRRRHRPRRAPADRGHRRPAGAGGHVAVPGRHQPGRPGPAAAGRVPAAAIGAAMIWDAR